VHNATHWPGEVALREKEFGIWNDSPGPTTWPGQEIALGLTGWACGAASGEPHRQEPARDALGRDRGARDRLHDAGIYHER